MLRSRGMQEEMRNVDDFNLTNDGTSHVEDRGEERRIALKLILKV